MPHRRCLEIRRGWESQKRTFIRETMKLNWNFCRGGEGFKLKIPSLASWIFSGTTLKKGWNLIINLRSERFLRVVIGTLAQISNPVFDKWKLNKHSGQCNNNYLFTFFLDYSAQFFLCHFLEYKLWDLHLPLFLDSKICYPAAVKREVITCRSNHHVCVL